VSKIPAKAAIDDTAVERCPGINRRASTGVLSRSLSAGDNESVCYFLASQGSGRAMPGQIGICSTSLLQTSQARSLAP